MVGISPFSLVKQAKQSFSPNHINNPSIQPSRVSNIGAPVAVMWISSAQGMTSSTFREENGTGPTVPASNVAEGNNTTLTSLQPPAAAPRPRLALKYERLQYYDSQSKAARKSKHKTVLHLSEFCYGEFLKLIPPKKPGTSSQCMSTAMRLYSKIVRTGEKNFSTTCSRSLRLPPPGREQFILRCE